MNDKSNIKAFTLSEMVVVLILTSIIVGLAFSVLSLVQSHMVGIQRNFNNTIELNKLEQSLALDFNRVSNIEYNPLEDVLTCTNEMDSIRYRFQETAIIKDMDTFHVQLQGKAFFFDGNQVKTGVIDAIKLETSKAMQGQHLFIFKKNDATQFMN